MLKRERQAFILHQVNIHNKVLSSGLSEEMKVSEDTIRRDLQELSDQGKIIKVHGGALSCSFSHVGYPSEKIYSHTHKKIIATKALGLIQDGMFILTTGGTTIVELARILPMQLRATFVSCSIPAILEYSNHPNIDIIVVGDKLSKNSKITVGGDAIATIRQIKADICLLGVNSIDIEHGVTDSDWEVVQIKKAMIASAKKTVCLTISEKVNTVQPLRICGLHQIDILATELPPENPLLQPYINAGIQVL